MNRKFSPTLIGAFVAGALVLVVIAVLVLGSGRLFLHSTDFILYFDSSVNGLRIGAPVKFKGVEIGSVKNILLQLEPDMKVKRIPVIIRIVAEKITKRGGAGDALSDPETEQALIVQGLRGQLQMESLLTGLLYVGLDFFPKTRANFVQPRDDSYPYSEIPTIPSIFEQTQDAASRIINKLENIDFDGLVRSVGQASNAIQTMVNSPALKSSLQSLQKTMPKLEEAIVSIRNVATTIDQNVQGLSRDLQQTSSETRATLKQAGETMKEAAETLANVRGLIDTDSPTFYELTRGLREVSAAARSLRQLANYLERNPTALIFGKPESKED